MKVTVEAHQCPHCNKVHLTEKAYNKCVLTCGAKKAYNDIPALRSSVFSSATVTEFCDRLKVYVETSKYQDGVSDVVITVSEIDDQTLVFTLTASSSKTVLYSRYTGRESFMGEFVADPYERGYSTEVSSFKTGNRYCHTITCDVYLSKLSSIKVFGDYRKSLVAHYDHIDELVIDRRNRINNKFRDSIMNRVVKEGIEETQREIRRLQEIKKSLDTMLENLLNEIDKCEPKPTPPASKTLKDFL